MERAIEIRRAGPYNPFAPEPCEPVRDTWFRANGALPEDPGLHTYLLAYASDMSFLPTAVQPHGVSLFSGEIQIATLDHAMWFHQAFRMDDWLLYHVDSPRANGGRALVRGQFFNRAGVLVASTMQEGVFRDRRRRPTS
jgi:acyl-CoA thioesterase-2